MAYSVPGQKFWVSGKSSRDSSGAVRCQTHSTWCTYELLLKAGVKHTPVRLEEIEVGSYWYLGHKTVL
jgi:hypothetical protein